MAETDAPASSEPLEAGTDGPCPARVVRCEKVLRARTGRVLLVLDRIHDPHNEAAVHRTAEALGVQHVWSVAPVLVDKKKRSAKAATLSRLARSSSSSPSRGSSSWIPDPPPQPTRNKLVQP